MPDVAQPDFDTVPVDHDPFPASAPATAPVAAPMVSDEDEAIAQFNKESAPREGGLAQTIPQLYNAVTTPEGRAKIASHLPSLSDVASDVASNLNPADLVRNTATKAWNAAKNFAGQVQTAETGTPEQEADFGANTAMQMVLGGAGAAEEGAAGIAGGALKQPEKTGLWQHDIETAAPGDHPGQISQRIAGAKDPVSAEGNVDLDSLKLTPKSYENNVDLVRNYPGVKIPKNASTDEAADAFVNHVSDNLKWLYNQVPDDVKAQSSRWYDGGNKIVKDAAEKYGIDDTTAAGVIAATSPQKDWYNNVSIARRIMDQMKGNGEDFYNNQKMTPEMVQQFDTTPSLAKFKPIVADMNGMSLGDIDKMMPYPKDERDIYKSLWIRLYDQAHNDPSVHMISPEGETMPRVSQHVAWGSIPEISKAVNIIDNDGNVDALNNLVGQRHKVRNFYNNLLAPDSTRGDVTIDTHAVGAGLLRPFSAQSTEVAHNFGNWPGKDIPAAKNSAKTGVWGTYPLYADAYRKAAQDVGVLPRQLQSVTWEAIRGLFTEGWKTPKNSAIVDNLWRQYGSGQRGLDETRQRILDAAGGINKPTWLQQQYGRPVASDVAARSAGDTSELPGLGSPGPSATGPVAGGGAGVAAEPAPGPAADVGRGAEAAAAPGVVGRGSVQPASGAPEDAIAAAQASAERAAAGRPKLIGLPDKPLKAAGNFVPGPVGYLHDIAEQYMRDEGFDYNPPKTYAPVDTERAGRIAKAFDDMKHDPSDPRVAASYDAMIQETLAQYEALKRAGVKFDFIQPGMEDPYKATPRLASKDVVDNKHLWVYPTDIGHGSSAEAAAALKNNPLLAPTDEFINGKRLLANDVFRIVHDMFGHIKDGNGFRSEGEENAWRSHSAMYSDLARPAMTAETRGQNSWLNYGPHGEKNRTASAADTIYADQKVGRLPDWVVEEGRHDPADFEPVEHDPFQAPRTMTLGSGATDDNAVLRAARTASAAKQSWTDKGGKVINPEPSFYRALNKNGALAGSLIVDQYRTPKEVFKVAVNPKYRRQGVATALYQQAEKDYGPLTPSSALSDEGFSFWRGYRPEAVQNDLRMHSDKLMGAPVKSTYGEGNITSIGSRAAIATTKGQENTWPVPKSEIARIVGSEGRARGGSVDDSHPAGWAEQVRAKQDQPFNPDNTGIDIIPGAHLPDEQQGGTTRRDVRGSADGGGIDKYVDFRRSQNVIDDTNESTAEKLYENFINNVTGKNDNWISDTSNWVTGNNKPPLPVPATTDDPLASSLGYNDVHLEPLQQGGNYIAPIERARGGRAPLPEKHGKYHIDYAFDIGTWGMYDDDGCLIKTGKIAQKRAHGGRVEPINIDPNPTEAQKHAGNYAKDHVHLHGLPITIENAKGGVRRGVGRDGQPWKSVLPAHYGYFNRTEGADGDHVDCYIGPHPKSPHIFVIDQVDHESKKFDEAKVMLGFGSKDQAVNYYKRGFSDGRGKDRIGRVTEVPVSVFKLWLRHGDTKKPFDPVVAH